MQSQILSSYPLPDSAKISLRVILIQPFSSHISNSEMAPTTSSSKYIYKHLDLLNQQFWKKIQIPDSTKYYIDRPEREEEKQHHFRPTDGRINSPKTALTINDRRQMVTSNNDCSLKTKTFLPFFDMDLIICK